MALLGLGNFVFRELCVSGLWDLAPPLKLGFSPLPLKPLRPRSTRFRNHPRRSKDDSVLSCCSTSLLSVKCFDFGLGTNTFALAT